MQDNVENSPGNVLIVDGNRECAERYARHLESRGYKTAIATPKEMLDALARFEATVALCDIEGPDAKGANLPGQLLKARPDAPVAFHDFWTRLRAYGAILPFFDVVGYRGAAAHVRGVRTEMPGTTQRPVRLCHLGYTQPKPVPGPGPAGSAPDIL